MKEIPANHGLVILVDDEDFASLSRHKWYVHKIRQYLYAFRDIYSAPRQYRRIYMHREIAGLKPGDRTLVDHRDHNGLNNQRDNLRTCTEQGNGANRKKAARPYTSAFKGVCFHRRARKWQAQIMVDQREIYLGSFESELDAAKVYNKAAQECFGEFALLNVIPHSVE